MKFGRLAAGCVSRFRRNWGGQVSLRCLSVYVGQLPWQRSLRSNSAVKVLRF